MRHINLLLLQILVAVVTLAAWYALTTYPVFGKILLPPFFFSNPLDVASQVVEWFVSGVIWKHLWVTLIEALLAFAIGSSGGVLVGFWFARQPRTAAVFDPYVKMVNALPRVVLAPIFTLWLGLGIWSKVALGVTLVFFIVFFNVYQGVKEVSPTVLANARMLGMSERQLMRHVYWPSALSWMFSSLHTSVGFAVVGAVVGEYLGSAAGLGYLIQQAEGVFDVAGEHAGDVEHAFCLLDQVAQARRGTEIFADHRAHHGKADRGVQRGKHPGQRRRPIDVAHQLPLAHAQHARIGQHRRADFLDALIDVEEHDEEHQRDAERHLRPDAKAEPEREDRRQHHARQRVDHLHIGIEHRGGARLAREPEADQHAAARSDRKRQQRLDQRHPQMLPDHAGDEPVDDLAGDIQRVGKEKRW